MVWVWSAACVPCQGLKPINSPACILPLLTPCFGFCKTVPESKWGREQDPKVPQRQPSFRLGSPLRVHLIIKKVTKTQLYALKAFFNTITLCITEFPNTRKFLLCSYYLSMNDVRQLNSNYGCSGQQWFCKTTEHLVLFWFKNSKGALVCIYSEIRTG